MTSNETVSRDRRTALRGSRFLKRGSSRQLYKQLSLVPVLIVIVFTAASALDYDANLIPQRALWFMTGAAGLLLIWIAQVALKRDWLSPPVVYGIIFWVFHFGLLFPAAVSPQILATQSRWATIWLDQPDTGLALLASLLFLACYVLGALFLDVMVGGERKEPTNNSDMGQANELITIGWALMALSLLMLLMAVADYGWRVLISGYSGFFAIHTSFSLPIVVLATGLMFQIAGGRKNQAVLQSLLLFFAPVALPVMLAGARTAPLFSLAAIICMMTLRGLRIPRVILLPAVVILLVVIATVKDVREQGVEAAITRSSRVEAQDPLTGLTELGGSLRPVVASIDFIRKRGEFFDGQTYIFPFMRQVERFTGTRGTPLTDERFIGERINRLYGSIGFSTVAEAYVNFGLLGVSLFSFMWGAVLNLLTNRATSPYRLALLASVLIPMFINIRNSFIFVPAWILMAMAVAAFGYFVLRPEARRRRRRTRARSQRSMKNGAALDEASGI